MNGEEITSALFVDFDNVYIGLKDLDPTAAERFASEPTRWLQWMEAGMIGPEPSRNASTQERRIIVRHCYLNPGTFSRYRPYFTRSGFSVVDCPPLTTYGKTSTDIHMVMGILDTLQLYAHVSEFIILSGDADFTPVLLRLRACNKRTATLTVGPASAAYRAASDRLLTENDFVEVGLSIASEDRDNGGPELADPATAEKPGGPVPGSENGDLSALREAALAEIQRTVAGSERAVSLGKAAQAVRDRFGERLDETQWAGTGSLRGLLRSGGDLGFEVTGGTPGYIVDPARHEAPRAKRTNGDLAELDPDLRQLVGRLHSITGVPALSSRQYGCIFNKLSEELSAASYQLTTTSKAVRDRCLDADVPISRQAINFVLKGIAYRRGFGSGSRAEGSYFGKLFVDNVLGLSNAAQLQLSDEDQARVTSWLTGEIASPSEEGEAAEGGG